jgi:hypothetical protein
LTSLTVDECASESGGDINLSKFSLPDIGFADMVEEGREIVTFSFEMLADTRSEIEEIVAAINTAPKEVEFYPRDSDRCVYATYAHATRPSTMNVLGNTTQYYSSTVEVYCRAGEQFGDEEGSNGIVIEPTLPYETATLTNSGHYAAPVDYIYMSGYYDPILEYADDLKLVIGEQELALCNQLLRGDDWKLDRYGNVEHTYFTNFPKIYLEQQRDIGGEVYCNYGTGGSVAYEAFWMGNSGTLMMPFHGPLPVKEDPYLEIVLSRAVGSPKAMYAFNPDLSDAVEVDFDLKVGLNKVWIPECDGQGFVAFGIQTDENASCTVSSIYGEVNRYVAIDAIPMVDPAEDFTIKIMCGEFSVHKLSKLQIAYRSAF